MGSPQGAIHISLFIVKELTAINMADFNRGDFDDEIINNILQEETSTNMEEFNMENDVFMRQRREVSFIYFSFLFFTFYLYFLFSLFIYFYAFVYFLFVYIYYILLYYINFYITLYT